MSEEIIQMPEEELSEILQIRREKLKKLQEEGKDPFQITKFVRTAYSTDVKNNYTAMENQDGIHGRTRDGQTWNG